ncbi:MAG: hypothetical protein EA426_00700 [Spirochaetaceae bacterium]|nr:MAG: hypothetical protein EA426_00700 [Spirochaetaceae bacterium]
MRDEYKKSETLMKLFAPHRLSFFLKVLLTAVVTPIILAGCPLMVTMFGEPGPLPITIDQERITLGWDSSSGAIAHAESAVESFNFYYRDRGTRDWSLVSSVAAGENPTFTLVADSVLGERTSGEFEFGVSSITRRGEESRIHSSIDFDAKPRGGWYIVWTRP